MDLFDSNLKKAAPLADRMRPNTLDEFVGQEHIVGKGKLLRRAIETDTLHSSIFFGPPGCGKTTLASIIANTTGSRFVKLNAVSSGVKDVRIIIDEAEKNLKMYNVGTYLLLDECHRWNKAQSDSILPALENGVIKFIGSTTENPMIAMTRAIVSRCRVFQFFQLSISDITSTMKRAIEDKERGLGNYNAIYAEDALRHIAVTANGDSRAALNAIELAVMTTPETDGVRNITLEVAEESIQKKVINCDDEAYYNMLSAFCKSLRGGDSNAALAWYARLIYAGVDPRIICRRIIAHASEDVGMANPQAMLQAVAAAQALEFNGMPEAGLNISQAIIFLCESPKSNSVCIAQAAAFADVENTVEQPVPVHLRDTSYSGAKSLGNGKGYKYPHDYPNHEIEQEYMPISVKGKVYYKPGQLGVEERIYQKHQAKNPNAKKQE